MTRPKVRRTSMQKIVSHVATPHVRWRYRKPPSLQPSKVETQLPNALPTIWDLQYICVTNWMLSQSVQMGMPWRPLLSSFILSAGYRTMLLIVTRKSPSVAQLWMETVECLESHKICQWHLAMQLGLPPTDLRANVSRRMARWLMRGRGSHGVAVPRDTFAVVSIPSPVGM